MKSPLSKCQFVPPAPTHVQPSPESVQHSTIHSNPVHVQSPAPTPNNNQQNDIHFLQIQEAFSKQYELNEKFDERIGYPESTTERIDANVDQVLDIIKQNFSNKTPRFEDSMHCDSEDYPSLHSHSSTPGKRQQCLP